MDLESFRDFLPSFSSSIFLLYLLFNLLFATRRIIIFIKGCPASMVESEEVKTTFFFPFQCLLCMVRKMGALDGMIFEKTRFLKLG